MPQFSYQSGLRPGYVHQVLGQLVGHSVYPCPVCGFGLSKPASDFTICPSCGVEFGYSDASTTFEKLRTEWVEYQAPWSSRVIPKPKGWNPWIQLIHAGFSYSLPYHVKVEEVSIRPNEGIEGQPFQYNFS